MMNTLYKSLMAMLAAGVLAVGSSSYATTRTESNPTVKSDKVEFRCLNGYDIVLGKRVWYARGLALKSQLKPQEAFVSFDKATEINTQFVQAWRERGEMLLWLRRYQEALVSVDKALSLKSEDFMLYYWRGMVLHALKRYTEAVEAYSQAININPTYYLYKVRSAAHQMLGNHQEALADSNKAIELNPELAPELAEGGVNSENESRDSQELQRALAEQRALADLNQAIEINPDNAEAYFNRGVARYNLVDLYGALADYNKAIEIKPDYAEAYSKRWMLRLLILGNSQGAIADFNKVIEIKPDDGKAYYYRAVLYNLPGGDRQKAIEYLHKAVQLFREQKDWIWGYLAEDSLRQLQQQLDMD